MRSILKNFTLLYAEDDIKVQQQMFEYFNTYFKKVYLADNGKKALELYKEHHPHVLILDIYMPELDGLELTTLIRKNDFKTKIAIISAYSENNLMLKAINANVNYYVIKPATLNEIKNMLDKISRELLRDTEQIISLDEKTHYHLFEKKLMHANEEVFLNHKESKLLEILMNNRGEAVSIHNIINFVWDDYNLDISFESVKSQVKYLRKKLPNSLISNVYGVGYMIKI
ncbi:MAG: response regulator transcription factor [Arcobacteraceae bacterium]|jgi:DNA-binding response OmpR family regulator|nr:response regulator transcription factor [Arcobacteraceae bacterium]